MMDFGRVTVKSDLQSENIGLEDATQMELEERLYDRLHIDFSDLQLLFCDSGKPPLSSTNGLAAKGLSTTY
mgnify:CR=1 FL=1